MLISKLINYEEINSLGYTKTQMDLLYPNNTPNKRGELGDALDNDPFTERQCRKCKLPLRASRYFYHPKCDPYATNEGVSSMPDAEDIVNPNVRTIRHSLIQEGNHG